MKRFTETYEYVCLDCLDFYFKSDNELRTLLIKRLHENHCFNKQLNKLWQACITPCAS